MFKEGSGGSSVAERSLWKTRVGLQRVNGMHGTEGFFNGGFVVGLNRDAAAWSAIHMKQG